MVDCGNGLFVDPKFVISIKLLEYRHNFGGGLEYRHNFGGGTVLQISMTTGQVHEIQHKPDYLNKINCYSIQKRILEAKQEILLNERLNRGKE